MQHLVTLTTTTKHIPEDIRQRDCRPSARRTGYLGSQTCLRWVFWWLKSLQSPFFGGAMGIYNFYFLVQRELSKGVDVSVFRFRCATLLRSVLTTLFLFVKNSLR